MQKEIRYKLPGDIAAERSVLFWAKYEEPSGISGQEKKKKVQTKEHSEKGKTSHALGLEELILLTHY